jgi:hypothetical protein
LSLFVLPAVFGLVGLVFLVAAPVVHHLLPDAVIHCIAIQVLLLHTLDTMPIIAPCTRWNHRHLPTSA